MIAPVFYGTAASSVPYSQRREDETQALVAPHRLPTFQAAPPRTVSAQDTTGSQGTAFAAFADAVPWREFSRVEGTATEDEGRTDARATPTGTRVSDDDPESTATTAPELSRADVENRDRLTLLARQFARKSLSREEEARLAVATERVRKLMPRVTSRDFDELASMWENQDRVMEADAKRRAELGLGE